MTACRVAQPPSLSPDRPRRASRRCRRGCHRHPPDSWHAEARQRGPPASRATRCARLAHRAARPSPPRSDDSAPCRRRTSRPRGGCSAPACRDRSPPTSTRRSSRARSCARGRCAARSTCCRPRRCGRSSRSPGRASCSAPPRAIASSNSIATCTRAPASSPRPRWPAAPRSRARSSSRHGSRRAFARPGSGATT